MNHLRHDSSWHRSLQGASGDQSGQTGVNQSGQTGVMAFLVLALLATCCLAAPSRLSRLLCRDNDRDNIETRERRVRDSLRPTAYMTPADRREYLLNLLVTKQVLIGGSKTEAEVQKFHNIILPRLNSSQHGSVSSRHGSVSSRHSVDSVEEEGLEPCAICLEHYEEGDEVCWSHNRHCDHVFHQECIVEWLGHHNECPICRQDFLSLEDLDNETDHAEQPESVEQSPAEETEDSPADEGPRVSWIRSLFQRQRIVQPIHRVELERPEANGASIHPWPSSHYEEPSVSIEDPESVGEGEGGAHERNETRATSLNATDDDAV